MYQIAVPIKNKHLPMRVLTNIDSIIDNMVESATETNSMGAFSLHNSAVLFKIKKFSNIVSHTR